MVEIRINKDTHNRDIIEETYISQAYCQAVSEWSADHDGKPWIYALLYEHSSAGGVIGAVWYLIGRRA